MIDVRRLRDDPGYRSGATKKGATDEQLDELLGADERRRKLQTERDDAQAKANVANKEIGRSAPEDRPAQIEAAAQLKSELADLHDRHDAEQAMVDELLLAIPNPAHESVPEGGEDEGKVIAEHGERREPPRLDHAEFGAAMGWVQSEQAVAMSGSRFAYVMGAAVRIEFAIVQWLLEFFDDRGFTPVVPPVLVREDMLVDAGFFPAERHQVYEISEDGLFLIGTSEIALAGLHRGERLDASELPRRYLGFSSCFRREAGTYGKDTRGIFRVHQFDKLEMFSYALPEQSWDELELLREIQEEIVRALELPYRVVSIAAGDLGPAAAKKYDLEVWLPSEGRYREATSCSNYLDYSARRMGTRVKSDQGTVAAHTLNGTACAIGRTLVFLFEHNQQTDGSFVVPEVLRPFCGIDVIPAAG